MSYEFKGDQKEAYEALLDGIERNTAMVLNGSAGSGKTFLAACVVDTIREQCGPWRKTRKGLRVHCVGSTHCSYYILHNSLSQVLGGRFMYTSTFASLLGHRLREERIFVPEKNRYVKRNKIDRNPNQWKFGNNLKWDIDSNGTLRLLYQDDIFFVGDEISMLNNQIVRDWNNFIVMYNYFLEWVNDEKALGSFLKSAWKACKNPVVDIDDIPNDIFGEISSYVDPFDLFNLKNSRIWVSYPTRNEETFVQDLRKCYKHRNKVYALLIGDEAQLPPVKLRHISKIFDRSFPVVNMSQNVRTTNPVIQKLCELSRKYNEYARKAHKHDCKIAKTKQPIKIKRPLLMQRARNDLVTSSNYQLSWQACASSLLQQISTADRQKFINNLLCAPITEVHNYRLLTYTRKAAQHWNDYVVACLRKRLPKKQLPKKELREAPFWPGEVFTFQAPYQCLANGTVATILKLQKTVKVVFGEAFKVWKYDCKTIGVYVGSEEIDFKMFLMNEEKEEETNRLNTLRNQIENTIIEPLNRMIKTKRIPIKKIRQLQNEINEIVFPDSYHIRDFFHIAERALRGKEKERRIVALSKLSEALVCLKHNIERQFALLTPHCAPSYAATVHKSQGQTVKHCLIDLDDILNCKVYKSFDRVTKTALIYTAISRAEESLICLYCCKQAPLPIPKIISKQEEQDEHFIPRPPKKNEPQYVYIAAYPDTNENKIKIGSANNPIRRLREHQSAYPEDMIIVYSFKIKSDRFQLESYLHNYFKKQKYTGVRATEWFTLTPQEVIEAVKELGIPYEANAHPRR